MDKRCRRGIDNERATLDIQIFLIFKNYFLTFSFLANFFLINGNFGTIHVLYTFMQNNPLKLNHEYPLTYSY